MFDSSRDQAILKKLSDSLAGNLTHSQIDDLLCRVGIENIGKKTQSVSFAGMPNAGYVWGDSKAKKIYVSLGNDLNRRKSDKGVIDFIEEVFHVGRYVNETEKFEKERLEINKILMLVGGEVNLRGKIDRVSVATTLGEIDERIAKLKNEIENRELHPEIAKYCSKEYLANDYFHASFEAAKGIEDRIRKMVDLKKDGASLIEQVFKQNEPMLWIKGFDPKNQTEVSEFSGLKDLIFSVHKMVRNPLAHTPRIYASNDLIECVEILTIISRIHRYLDKCEVIRYGND